MVVLLSRGDYKSWQANVLWLASIWWDKLSGSPSSSLSLPPSTLKGLLFHYLLMAAGFSLTVHFTAQIIILFATNYKNGSCYSLPNKLHQIQRIHFQCLLKYCERQFLNILKNCFGIIIIMATYHNKFFAQLLRAIDMQKMQLDCLWLCSLVLWLVWARVDRHLTVCQ